MSQITLHCVSSAVPMMLKGQAWLINHWALLMHAGDSSCTEYIP